MLNFSILIEKDIIISVYSKIYPGACDVVSSIRSSHMSVSIQVTLPCFFSGLNTCHILIFLGWLANGIFGFQKFP